MWSDFKAAFCLKFNSVKSTCFKVISQVFLDDAKAWSDQMKTILNSWSMYLQISHGKYTLFSANFFVGLRA